MKKLSFIFVFGLFIFLTACSEDIESNMSKDVPDGEFTDQNGDTVTLSDLEGKWWVTDLIFTNCTDVCIPMTTNMVNLQKEFQEKDLDVHIVSFTVDPEYDSPEVLKDYADEYGADLSNWSFLTGYEFETIQEIAEETFLSSVEKVPDSDQVGHGTKFYLVNPEGEVIKFYSGLDSDEINELVEDLEKVL